MSREEVPPAVTAAADQLHAKAIERAWALLRQQYADNDLRLPREDSTAGLHMHNAVHAGLAGTLLALQEQGLIPGGAT